MDYIEHAHEILYDSYIKLALVNLDSGEYVSLISVDGKTGDCDTIGEAMDYYRSSKGYSSCHPDDVKDFVKLCDMDYLRRLIEGGTRSMTRNFRFRLRPGEDYAWLSVDIEAGRGGGDLWVLFGMRQVCPDILALDDSVRLLTNVYHRIYKINITDDTFVKIRDEIADSTMAGESESLRVYMSRMAESGDVHPDYMDQVKKCFNENFLREFFAAGHDRFAIRYKRKIDMVYRWVMTEIIPTAAYRSDNREFYMYIRDIHEEYAATVEKQELLKFYSYRDSLTHLANRNSFTILCDAYLSREAKAPVGFLFNDVNKLKYVNDNFGHKEGDLYLQRIAHMLSQQFGENACYRISGDEFVVVFIDISEEKFASAVSRFRAVLAEQEEPPVAVGAVWCENPETIDEVMNEAEKKMYEDKLHFYSAHPEVKRRGVDAEVCDDGKDRNTSYRNLGRTDRIFDALAATTLRNFMYMQDMDTGVTKWSVSAVEYFGLSGQYIYDTKEEWGSLIHPDDREKFEKDIDAVFAGKKKYHDVEYRVRNKDGEYVVCTCRGLITKKVNGEPEFFVGTVINHGIIAGVDPVTGLHNQQEYTKYIQRKIDGENSMTILAVGISMFNSINMMYGYATGNSALGQFAEKTKALVGGRGLLFRLEGAKFAICSDDYSKEEIVDLYRQIQRLALEHVGPEDDALPLKVYGGALLYDHAVADAEVVKSSVEYALERSTEDNHGDLVFFNEEIKSEDRMRLKIYSSIHKCVLNNMEGFFLCYQPIANSQTGEIIGMEALLRWKQEEFGVVQPAVFIPWLEMEPCFFELGNWIIERALLDGLEVRRMRPEFVVNVNISATQIENCDFRKSVRDILARTGFPPEYFCMELTERCKHLDLKFLKRELEYFRGMGIRVALDDFGTGSATLNLLTELPIDELKVDMSFVKGIQSSKTNQVLVQAVVSCANQLGYKSCIEGVENEALFDYLHRYGSTYYQGYHFSKPVPLSEFTKLL